MNTETLIWLFPIVFMAHDFEELIFGEAWLRKNEAEIQAKLASRLPATLSRWLNAVFAKSTAELAVSIGLIFALAVAAAWLAAVHGRYAFFLAASMAFFLHGFMHVGQALLLRRYVPAVISSVLVAIPYGLALFPRLLAESIVDRSGLLLYGLLGAVLVIPLILVMHKAGEVLYHWAARLLIR